jgi:HEAT repeat protein
MQPNNRLNTISYLLDTALDSEEEYVYHGEMSDYVRSYASDAAEELDWLFRASAPTTAEIELCVKALSDPERIRRGRSKELLIRLRERSRPILEALANSPDPHLRIFALETGNTSLNPYFHNPLYGSIELDRRLLEDPDESVRVVAVSSSQPTIVHNARYLEGSLRRGDSNPLLDFLSRIAARLRDPSPRVRTEAANVLSRWAAEVGEETLEMLLERENNPKARETIARTKASIDPGMSNDHPALNDHEQEC